jgi:hypothetical protein
MRWSHLHGDMQGRRGALEDTSSARIGFIGLSKVLSEIPCRVSSDLHEWRNDFSAVSTMGSVKLQSR